MQEFNEFFTNNKEVLHFNVKPLVFIKNFLISVEIIHNHLQYPSNNKESRKQLLVELLF